MTISILHLSDLHKDKTDEIPSKWLIESILRDLERALKEPVPIPSPDIAIVSGDIVYGVNPSNPDSKTELDRQYADASDFLCQLCDSLFDGDRNRIILIPGNHDVDYPTMIKSGEFIAHPRTDKQKQRLLTEFFTANSALKWSWSALSFFRILDQTQYESRFSHFQTMYNAFYNSTRFFSLSAAEQYDVFDYPDLALSFITLNSCYNNDPLNRMGSFNPDAFTTACRLARDPSRSGWTIGAVWHHNLVGGHLRQDFLDAAFLQIMIDSGISLGFHGHQHRSECFDERYRLGPERRKINIISAGTLCAEGRALSAGVPRGYNVVLLDDERKSGRVHQRQMVNHINNLPVWGPGKFHETNQAYLDFEMSLPLSARPDGLDKQLTLERASELLGKGQWRAALGAITGLEADPTARSFIQKALSELDEPQLTIQTLMDVRSIAEATLLGTALLEAGRTSEIENFLSKDFVARSTDASLAHIKQKLQRKKQ